MLLSQSSLFSPKAWIVAIYSFYIVCNFKRLDSRGGAFVLWSEFCAQHTASQWTIIYVKRSRNVLFASSSSWSTNEAKSMFTLSSSYLICFFKWRRTSSRFFFKLRKNNNSFEYHRVNTFLGNQDSSLMFTKSLLRSRRKALPILALGFEVLSTLLERWTLKKLVTTSFREYILPRVWKHIIVIKIKSIDNDRCSASIITEFCDVRVDFEVEFFFLFNYWDPSNVLDLKRGQFITCPECWLSESTSLWYAHGWWWFWLGFSTPTSNLLVILLRLW